MIKAGADINGYDSHGWSPLACAAHSGEAHVAILLLDEGASVEAGNGKGSGWTALMAAAQEGRVDVMEVLLRNGVSP